MSARRVGAGGLGRTGVTRLSPFFSAKVMSFSPVVYGRHNEGSGTTLVDASGNGHGGTYTSVTLGGASAIATEPLDGSGVYNGTSSKAAITYGSWMDAATAVTVYAVAKSSSPALQALLDRDNGSSLRVWQFRLNGGPLEFVKIGGTGGVITSSTTPTGYADGVTHHFGATYDGSNIRLYVDGVKVKTTAAAGDLGTNAQLLQVATNAGGSNWFSGTIDDWFVANSVLTDADFASLYELR